jgi:hypothetical protein
MSREDQGAGPQLGQTVLYNNSGTMAPAVINQVNSNGTVGLYAFLTGGPAQESSVVQGTGSGQWSYPAFL